MRIYKALTSITSDMAKTGLAKNQSNKHGGYNFRGIDDVYNAISPLLAKHGVCIMPRVISRESVERTSKNGGAMFYVTVDVEFDFICAEDGSKHTVKMFGEAMDSSDKATNKAMSAAYKYAMFQVFCIPTEAHDADSETPEVINELARSVVAIKDAIKSGDISGAAECWFELSDEEKKKLWVAPSKGGPFTTAERDLIKSKEFRLAYYGEDAA